MSLDGDGATIPQPADPHCCGALSFEDRERAGLLRITCGPTRCARTALEQRDERAADLAIACAWLRVHSDLLRPFDQSGQLSASLADHADLLEVAQREGWFG